MWLIEVEADIMFMCKTSNEISLNSLLLCTSVIESRLGLIYSYTLNHTYPAVKPFDILLQIQLSVFCSLTFIVSCLYIFSNTLMLQILLQIMFWYDVNISLYFIFFLLFHIFSF
jgi:hypothetical protein